MRVLTKVIKRRLAMMNHQLPIALTNTQHIGLVELPIQMVMLTLATFSC